MKSSRKTINMNNKQRGMSTVDVMIAVAFIIGGLVLTFLIYPQIVSSKNIAMYQADSATIVSGVERWKKARSNYTGVSIPVLCAQNILTKGGTICGSSNNGKNTNPYGGNWTVAAASNPGLFSVTGTLPNDPNVVPELADAMAPTTRGNCQSATGCSTIKVAGTSLTTTH